MEAAATSPSTRPYGGVSAAERVDVRRRQLLEAGLELFGTAGFLEPGVKDICGEAGLTDRYFYESFADKRDPVHRRLRRDHRPICSHVSPRQFLPPTRSPRPRCRRRSAASSTTLDTDPRKARIVFAEAAAVGGEAEQHMRSTLRRFSDLVAETWRAPPPRGRRRGVAAGRSRSRSSGPSTRSWSSGRRASCDSRSRRSPATAYRSSPRPTRGSSASGRSEPRRSRGRARLDVPARPAVRQLDPLARPHARIIADSKRCGRDSGCERRSLISRAACPVPPRATPSAPRRLQTVAGLRPRACPCPPAWASPCVLARLGFRSPGHERSNARCLATTS